MELNDDSLILNITMPKPKASPSMIPLTKSPNKIQKNQERRDKAKQNRIFEKNFGKQKFEKKRREIKSNGLNSGSKKIQKLKTKKRSPKETNEPEQPRDIENLLDIDEKKDQETDIFVPNSFKDIPNLNERVASTLESHGFSVMTKIQKEAIPIIMKNKSCLIKSETGSGKTLAYLVIYVLNLVIFEVPIVNYLSKLENKISRNDGSFCFIICPTRELCTQVVEITKKLLKACINVVCGELMGGESIKKEKARLRKGINILVSTPGRLLYHIKNTASFDYKNLKFLVFEESDRTLDMGFKNDLEEISGKIHQRSDYDQILKILISANFTEKIEALWLKLSPKDSKKVGFSNNNPLSEANTIQDDSYKLPSKLAHKYVIVEERKRMTFLLSILMFTGTSKIMIFVLTCDEVDYLEMLFKYSTYKSEEGSDPERIIKTNLFKLHGKLDQKSRTEMYFQFKKAESGIMICTDVASRGLDFDDVKLIIQLDAPPTITDYVNRMGRTARIGHYGMSLLFLTSSELDYVKKLRDNKLEIEKYEEEDYYEYVEGKIKQDFDYESSAHSFLDNRIREFTDKDALYRIKARRAYVSYLRAYARHEDKNIFVPKKLNLDRLAKSFGLQSAQASSKEIDDKRYAKENIRKLEKKLQARKGGPRKPVASNLLEKMEFM